MCLSKSPSRSAASKVDVFFLLCSLLLRVLLLLLQSGRNKGAAEKSSLSLSRLRSNEPGGFGGPVDGMLVSILVVTRVSKQSLSQTLVANKTSSVWIEAATSRVGGIEYQTGSGLNRGKCQSVGIA